jgi:two-component system sensor histidine kinase UhpB
MRLRPTAAAELGLRRALDDLLAFWRHRRPDMRLDLAFEVDETGVPPDVREVAYRVVQEALSNAVRHAGAGAIEVRLHLKDGGLMCDVADDGRSDAASGASAGFGLVGMRERVASSGGRLAFGPTAGQSGWRVCAYLPIQAEASGRPPGVRWR